MPLTKLFVGGLDATSAVEMIGARTAAKGSAGYVAIERVRGALDGREGSFVLQHSGTQRGSVTVTTNGRISRRCRNSEHHFASSGVSSTVGD